MQTITSTSTEMWYCVISVNSIFAASTAATRTSKLMKLQWNMCTKTEVTIKIDSHPLEISIGQLDGVVNSPTAIPIDTGLHWLDHTQFTKSGYSHVTLRYATSSYVWENASSYFVLLWSATGTGLLWVYSRILDSVPDISSINGENLQYRLQHMAEVINTAPGRPPLCLVSSQATSARLPLAINEFQCSSRQDKSVNAHCPNYCGKAPRGSEHWLDIYICVCVCCKQANKH